MGTLDMSRKGRFRPKGRQAARADLAELNRLLDGLPGRRDLLIEYLHRIQDAHGHLRAGMLVALAEVLGLASVEVYEVATFYHHFDVAKDDGDAPPKLTVRVCDSLSCALAGAEELVSRLQGLFGDSVRVQRVSCVGRCETAPVAVVGRNPVCKATPERVRASVERRHIEAPLPDVLGYHAYRAGGGYERLSGLREADEAAFDRVIESVECAGLRGLGGAGFSAGRKWRIVRGQPRPKFLVVNIDEGEPGTFKDRHYLERDPHRFLEGMLIAARVIGADAAYIYLRDEYAGCRAVLGKQLALLQSDPPCALPSIELRRGAGAYICGEESALIESIEGKRGMPRLRPPYVAEAGLFGRPTLVHNLETLYWVRDILDRGSERFADQGRRGRKGLRSFSVSGRVRRPGVYLADAGISLRELIDEYCGGMADGHELKAYFPGGASGGILPASLADLPLDFDTLQDYGCFIGSAAVIVLSDRDSVRDAALNAMRFFARESCGRCTPCRVGTEKASILMAEQCWDQALLGDLVTAMADASICGLGQAAGNPLLSVLRYFPEEVG